MATGAGTWQRWCCHHPSPLGVWLSLTCRPSLACCRWHCTTHRRRPPVSTILQQPPGCGWCAPTISRACVCVCVVVTWQLTHCPVPPLPNGCTPALLVDEASMLDIHLASSLFGALGLGDMGEGSSDSDGSEVASTARPLRVVLVGDVNQLPSVGPGRVLADLLAARGLVPSTVLHEVQGRPWPGMDGSVATHCRLSCTCCDRCSVKRLQVPLSAMHILLIRYEPTAMSVLVCQCSQQRHNPHGILLGCAGSSATAVWQTDTSREPRSRAPCATSSATSTTACDGRIWPSPSRRAIQGCRGSGGAWVANHDEGSSASTQQCTAGFRVCGTAGDVAKHDCNIRLRVGGGIGARGRIG